MGLQFLFMDDNAPCHRTVAAKQLLESEDIECMDWPARSPYLNPIEHVWYFLGRRLAARTLPPVTIRELRLTLQDEWPAMPQQLIDTLILSMGRRCETLLANSPDYDDFIDIFSVPTPISPLPPTTVASPSHEPSQDAIYDSLPPMEQSTVPESPLKDLLPESPLKDLLPVEQSRVSESPLKDPVDSKPPIVSKSPDPLVKKVDSVIHRSPRSRERRNEERRNEERRPRESRLYRRPDFRPPYLRHDFKPRVFRRPPYAQQLMPKSFPQPRFGRAVY
ncbi:transposable element Tc3 transposase [Trichonephila clavipes]|nr:transposable element Tc3 transposase [Trichonephila clavipes]